MTKSNISEILKRAMITSKSRTLLAQSLIQPLRRNIDYQSVGRRTFFSEDIIETIEGVSITRNMDSQSYIGRFIDQTVLVMNFEGEITEDKMKEAGIKKKSRDRVVNFIRSHIVVEG